MTLPLTRRAGGSCEAKVEDCLRVCGAQPWPEAELWRYQDEQEKRIVSAHFAAARAHVLSCASLGNTCAAGVVASIFAVTASLEQGGMTFGLYLCIKLLYHIWGLPYWQTNNLLEENRYWRDGIKQPLPDPVRNVVDAARSFFPHARFAVSFLGSDPILHVLLNGRSYAALVWEMNADGSVEIIPPPAA